MNYTELIADKQTSNSIANWLNWDLAPSASILAEAESYIYGELRVREMKGIATGTITLAAQTLSLPADFIAPISFRRSGASAGRIEILDSEHMESRNVIDADNVFVTSVPTECQIIGDPPVVYFNVKSDAAHPYRLVYWKRPAALAGDNLTNFLTTRYPQLLRTACLMRGWEFRQDLDQERKYEMRLEGLIEKANAEYDMGEQANRFEMHTGD